jgi:hypothetical protein
MEARWRIVVGRLGIFWLLWFCLAQLLLTSLLVPDGWLGGSCLY